MIYVYSSKQKTEIWTKSTILRSK